MKKFSFTFVFYVFAVSCLMASCLRWSYIFLPAPSIKSELFIFLFVMFVVFPYANVSDVSVSLREDFLGGSSFTSSTVLVQLKQSDV